MSIELYAFAPGKFPEALQTGVSRWWLGELDQKRIPEYSQFDILKLPGWEWERVSISTYEPENDDFRFRVYSSAARRVAGRNLSGSFFLSNMPDDIATHIRFYLDYLFCKNFIGLFIGQPVHVDKIWVRFFSYHHPISHNQTKGLLHYGSSLDQQKYEEYRSILDFTKFEKEGRIFVTP